MTANLSTGSASSDVKRLQEMLNYLANRAGMGPQCGSALPALAMDGIFGAKTKARVAEFQGKALVKADGIVGPISGRALVASVITELVRP